ncbi:MAG: protein phosphatase CheZ [Azoarcus sp.]|jgi:chemotaxis protein CheZ|nr:protein phosphatase CheZ [Azoarcus sp.]
MVSKRPKADETGDSNDLQALFDNIAAGKDAAPPAPVAAKAPARPAAQPAPPAPAPAKPVAPPAGATDDNDELQALFDAEASKFAVQNETAGGADENSEAGSDEAVFHRIGKMTRKLHDALIELGLDGALQEVADTIPDARQRLTYVAQMTEQAASRVLNATDVAKPIADKLESCAESLHARWDKTFANQITVDEFKTLAADTRTFLGAVAEGSRALNTQLLEIMMAQDFQDLTGQVIKKVVEMAQTLESQLLEMLIEVVPESMRTEKTNTLLNGPVINTQGRDDIVTSQGQVDDLLESLGF